MPKRYLSHPEVSRERGATRPTPLAYSSPRSPPAKKAAEACAYPSEAQRAPAFSSGIGTFRTGAPPRPCPRRGGPPSLTPPSQLRRAHAIIGHERGSAVHASWEPGAHDALPTRLPRRERLVLREQEREHVFSCPHAICR